MSGSDHGLAMDGAVTDITENHEIVLMITASMTAIELMMPVQRPICPA